MVLQLSFEKIIWSKERNKSVNYDNPEAPRNTSLYVEYNTYSFLIFKFQINLFCCILGPEFYNDVSAVSGDVAPSPRLDHWCPNFCISWTWGHSFIQFLETGTSEKNIISGNQCLTLIGYGPFHLTLRVPLCK